jgi:hypothetical protein
MKVFREYKAKQDTYNLYWQLVRKYESEYFDAFILLNADIWMEGMLSGNEMQWLQSVFLEFSQCICTPNFGNRPQKKIALQKV